MGKALGKATDFIGITNISDQKKAGREARETSEFQAGKQQEAVDYLSQINQLPSGLKAGAQEQYGALFGIDAGDPNADLRTDLQSQIDTLQGEMSQPQKSQQFKFKGKMLGGLIDKAMAGRNQQRTDEISGLQTQLSEIPEYTQQSQQQLQQTALSGLQQSPIYQAIMGGQQMGEEAILRHAGATGGLRSGGVQGSLGKYAQELNTQALQQSMGGLQNMMGLQTLEMPIYQGMGGIGQTLAQGQTAQSQANLAASQQATQFPKELLDTGANMLTSYLGGR